MVKFQCFKGSSIKSKVTIAFNIIMIVTMIIKFTVMNNITDEL